MFTIQTVLTGITKILTTYTRVTEEPMPHFLKSTDITDSQQKYWFGHLQNRHKKS